MKAIALRTPPVRGQSKPRGLLRAQSQNSPFANLAVPRYVLMSGTQHDQHLCLSHHGYFGLVAFWVRDPSCPWRAPEQTEADCRRGNSIGRSASAAVPCLYGVRRYFAASPGPERSRCDRLPSSFSEWTFRRAQSETAISDRGSGPTFIPTLIVFRLEAP